MNPMDTGEPRAEPRSDSGVVRSDGFIVPQIRPFPDLSGGGDNTNADEDDNNQEGDNEEDLSEDADLPELPVAQPEPYFVCSECSIGRARHRLAYSDDDNDMRICDYCANERTGKNLVTEMRWCIFGLHEASRLDFLSYNDDGEEFEEAWCAEHGLESVSDEDEQDQGRRGDLPTNEQGQQDTGEQVEQVEQGEQDGHFRSELHGSLGIGEDDSDEEFVRRRYRMPAANRWAEGGRLRPRQQRQRVQEPEDPEEAEVGLSDDELVVVDDGPVEEEEEEPEEDEVTRRTRAPNMTKAEKIRAIKALIAQYGLSQVEFFRTWVGTPGTQPFRNKMNSIAADMGRLGYFSKHRLRNQLKALPRKVFPFFGRFDPNGSMDTADLKAVIALIKQVAPDWYALAEDLMKNKASHTPVYKNVKGVHNLIPKRIMMLTMIATHSIALIDSSWFPKTLGIFFLTSGVKRRVVDVLNNLGLCPAYETSQGDLKDVAEHQVLRIKEMAQDPRAEWTYDNFNRQKRRREQIVGDINEQWNMTTSYIRINPHIPATGLTQDMLDHSVEVDADEIVEAIVTDTYGEKIAKYHIDQALAAIFGDEIRALFRRRRRRGRRAAAEAEDDDDGDGDDSEDDEGPQRPKWPVIEEIEAVRTELLSLPVSSFEEQSIQGTYAVQHDILVNFSGLDTQHDFNRRLIILNGDCLSVERCRSVKMESLESSDAFESRKWSCANPAEFHKVMNLANTVIRTHWSQNPDGEELKFSIKKAADIWGYKGITNQNPKFYLTQKILVRMFQSAVVGQAIQVLVDMGVDMRVPQDLDRLTGTRKAFSQITREQYLEMVDTIYKQSFSREAWHGSNHQGDNDFTSQARMLIEIARFLTHRKAVRMQDIGHLKRHADHLIVPFWGAGQNNYGKEMIYQKWLLSDAADPVLRKALLSAATVNPSGRRGKAVASDEMLELHNLEYSQDISGFANSTHDLAATFRRKSLNREAARVIRNMMESGISRKASNSHSAKDASVDVFSLADKLLQEESSKIQPGKGGVLSLDIEAAGIALLQQKVDEFNDQNRQYSRGIAGAPIEVDEGTGEDVGRRQGEEEPYGPIEEAVVDRDADEELLFYAGDGWHFLMEGPVETMDLTGE